MLMDADVGFGNEWQHLQAVVESTFTQVVYLRTILRYLYFT